MKGREQVNPQRQKEKWLSGLWEFKIRKWPMLVGKDPLSDRNVLELNSGKSSHNLREYIKTH